GRARRAWQVPEPDGEPVAGALERDVDVELVDDPEPQSKAAVGGAACGGGEGRGVICRGPSRGVDRGHDALPRRPPSPRGRRAGGVPGVGAAPGYAGSSVPGGLCGEGGRGGLAGGGAGPRRGAG